jgi:hypothetical protein
LTDDLRRKFLERLHANLADTNAVVRAKAVRSLGKLAKAGHLRPPERETLEAVEAAIARGEAAVRSGR